MDSLLLPALLQDLLLACWMTGVTAYTGTSSSAQANADAQAASTQASAAAQSALLAGQGVAAASAFAVSQQVRHASCTLVTFTYECARLKSVQDQA